MYEYYLKHLVSRRPATSQASHGNTCFIKFIAFVFRSGWDRFCNFTKCHNQVNNGLEHSSVHCRPRGLMFRFSSRRSWVWSQKVHSNLNNSVNQRDALAHTGQKKENKIVVQIMTKAAMGST